MTSTIYRDEKAEQLIRRQIWLAGQMVHRAIKRGELPRLDGAIPCKDCGRPAIGYDHRDYSSPLVVEPVCASCNAKRGHAVNAVPRYGIRFSMKRSEEIRKSEGMDLERFSIAIGYTARSYPKAVERGTLTYRMALGVSRRFGVKLKELGQLDGEKR